MVWSLGRSSAASGTETGVVVVVSSAMAGSLLVSAAVVEVVFNDSTIGASLAVAVARAGTTRPVRIVVRKTDPQLARQPMRPS